jgi:lysophospholipid hydrolase
MGKLKLLSWLTEQEEQSRLVLYVADGGSSAPWTQRCIRQVRSLNLSLMAGGLYFGRFIE